MRSRKLALAFGIFLAAATPASAFAQNASATSAGTKEPYATACTSVTPLESEKAHKLYEVGKGSYDEGNYELAIPQFREAYKKDCSKHDLLIIISRAYELNHNTAEAIYALQTYLDRVPNAGPENRTKLENLKTLLAKEKAAAAAAAANQPATPAKQVEMREHTIPPWIVVGAGGVAVVAGIIVLATAPDVPEGCVKSTTTCSKVMGETPTQFEKRQEEAGRAKDQPTYGVVAMVGGLVIVAGGLVWHFLEPTGPVEGTASGKIKPKVTPQAGPGYAGLSLGASF